MDNRIFPGLPTGGSFAGSGSPLLGGPTPAPPSAPAAQIRKLLWRSQTYRLKLTGNTSPSVLAATRYQVGAILIFADLANFAAIYLGNRELAIDGSGIAKNCYVSLDPGRSWYIYTDDPFNEFIDVSQIYALSSSQSGSNYVHVTPFVPQVL